MSDESLNRKLRELLHDATLPMSAGWEGRAEQAMTGATPRPRRLGRALVVAGVCTAVALVALGLNPSPWTASTAAWDQAVAAAAQARTMHVVGTINQGADQMSFEAWESADGFRRFELWGADDLGFVELRNGAQSLWYFGWHSEGILRVNPASYVPLNSWWSDTSGPGLLAAFHPFARQCSDMKMKQHREPTPSGVLVDVIEAEGTVRDHEFHSAAYGVAYNGMPLRFRAEVNVATGRLSSLAGWRGSGEVSHTDPDSGRCIPGPGILDCLWKASGTSWVPIYTTDVVEWDVAIPQSAREFEWPSGTRVRYERWWETRGKTELATASLPEGELILHALDVNERGDVFVSLSRPGCTHVEWGEGSLSYNPPSPRLGAVDDTGHRYSERRLYHKIEGQHRDYIVTTLRMSEDDGDAHSITLTVWPWSREAAPDRKVIFEGLRLPQRQPGVELYDDSRHFEVIQY